MTCCHFAPLLFGQKSVFLLYSPVFRWQSLLVLPGELRYLISVDGGSVTHLSDEPSVRVPQSAGWSASINAFNLPWGQCPPANISSSSTSGGKEWGKSSFAWVRAQRWVGKLSVRGNETGYKSTACYVALIGGGKWCCVCTSFSLSPPSLGPWPLSLDSVFLSSQLLSSSAFQTAEEPRQRLETSSWPVLVELKDVWVASIRRENPMSVLVRVTLINHILSPGCAED